MSELSSKSYNQPPEEQVARTADALNIALYRSHGRAHAYIDPKLPMREAAELFGQHYGLRVESTADLMQNRFRPFEEHERGAIVVGYNLDEDRENGYALQTVMRSRHNQSPDGTNLLILTDTLPPAELTENADAPFWNGPITYDELWQLTPQGDDGLRMVRTESHRVGLSYEWRPDPTVDIDL